MSAVSDIDLLAPTYQPGLTTYRAFHLDAEGRIALAEIIDARSDDEAIDKARILANAYGLDLWERARHLASFPPRVTVDQAAASLAEAS